MQMDMFIVFLSYFLLASLDVIIICDARRLLLDFLIGQRNRKNARRIHAEQTFKNRVNMGYIQPMLSKYQSAFKKYHVLYLVVLYSLIPQYVAIVLFQIFAPNIVKYILGVCLAARFLLSGFYRRELGPQGMSVYAKKK